jgi:predicted  nucleic acid-binding Zn-ribbon protein|nr:MAG TPA: hypothetical protein [Caudoviricetes sp.]
MIKVRSKTLFIPAEEQSIGAVGEADSTVREFHIDRVSGDGVDLANLLFKLNIRYAGVRDIDRSDLEKVITDNAIILRWLISSVTMSHAGTAFIQLDAFDSTGSCRWKSYPGAVYIEKSLGNTEISSNTLSELEQLEKKFAKVGEGESARVEAEKKRVSAEEKREEAEGKRNTSLANIIAEEEKIKAVSAEAKGYKDSVSADKQEISAMKQEAVSAKTEALQHANAAEASKNSTITEGTKIKEAVTALKNEANTAKADAVNAKNEAVSAKNGANVIKGEVLALKNGANTIKGEVQALKNETESRIQSAESNIQNQVMNATSSANMAERASQQAEGYKMEAGVSAEKAKESETKTLEALKKAQEGGKVAGVTSDEMHSYVDTAVGKIKSGITEAEAIAVVGSELKKKQVPQKDYKALTKTLVSGENSTLENIGENTLVDGKTLSSALSGVAEGTKERFLDKSGLNGAVTPIVENVVKERMKGNKDAEGAMRFLLANPYSSVSNYAENALVSGKAFESTVKTIGSFVNGRIEDAAKTDKELSRRIGYSGTALEIMQRIKRLVKYNDHTFIMPWDYIDIPTTIPGTENMRFYVMGIDIDESKNSIDFISFDYPERILMTEEELKSFGSADDEKILGLVNNKIKSDQRLGELNSLANLGLISKIKRFYGNMKTQNEFHFWTIDLGEVFGLMSFLFSTVEGLEMSIRGSYQVELFKTIKYRRFMNKGKYLTCSCRPDFVTVLDEQGIPRKLSLKDAFGVLPQGTSQEDVRKLRPIIPVCFRVASAE